jgi:hypothetical protein
LAATVAWFDKSALKAGDPWERQILGAIQKYSLFLPLLSANTEQRYEGYFRREWDEASERARRIGGRKFIFPIVIDHDYKGDMAATLCCRSDSSASGPKLFHPGLAAGKTKLRKQCQGEGIRWQRSSTVIGVFAEGG